jgi:hypothetical protein
MTLAPALVPKTSYEPSGSLRTVVTVTVESLALTAAVTVVSSVPVVPNLW